MAAGAAREHGCEVDLYESQGSVGRKFLLAGKGGLNLTHAEPFEPFVARFGERADRVRDWLAGFDNTAVRQWAHSLGVGTIVGSSQRVFPEDLKAAPLLRRWVRRLRAAGVRFHVQHRWLGMPAAGQLLFATADAQHTATADATVLALGGGSWPRLGSDGDWVRPLQALGVDIAPLKPSNCGFDVAWSPVFSQRHAGAPVKSVRLSLRSVTGTERSLQSEFVITAGGIEGSGVYALSASARELIERDGTAVLDLDLAPDRPGPALRESLSAPRAGRSLSEHLRRVAGISGVKAGLLYETLPRARLQDPAALAAGIKCCRLRLLRPRPLAEAISTAGGVRLEGLDEVLMLHSLPGVFCAGEMLDWEAPTGGYLLTACLASGRIAGHGAARWLVPRVAP
jgi:uncharacterized flavoprotein (TIGR03862 family)